MHSASLQFDFDDETTAAVVTAAVEVECGEIADDRCRAVVERDGSTLTVVVDAEDLVALRAGLNTWSSLIEVAESVVRGETPAF
ncbi:MAG: KEOPS complex subunit Pcc1 [Natronomonas sp.]